MGGDGPFRGIGSNRIGRRSEPESERGTHRMRVVRREDSVGLHVAHDLTQVVPGVLKQVVLRRGDVVDRDHLAVLASMGKEHIWVLEDTSSNALPGVSDPLDADGGERVHENDAATVLARHMAGPGVRVEAAREGKCTLVAEMDGLIDADVLALDALNLKHTGRAGGILRGQRIPVQAGDPLGIARIYPKALTRAETAQLESLAPLVQVRPFRPFRAGVVVTGQEVASGRIPDAFGPLIVDKLAAYGSTVDQVVVVADDPDGIAAAIRLLAGTGVTLLFVTGGMAVDPDDVTLDGILRAGTELEFFGVPMQPATLLLLGKLDDIPLFGVPAGVLFDPYSALDRLLPWVLAGVWPCREDVMRMGSHGMLTAGHVHPPHAGGRSEPSSQDKIISPPTRTRPTAGEGRTGDGARRDTDG